MASKFLGKSYKTFLNNFVSLTIFLFLWEILSITISSPFFPNPLDVWEAFLILLLKGDVEGISLTTHIVASVSRVLLGFGLAVVTGIPLGLVMGLKRVAYGSVRSILEPLRFIPPIAWIPLAIILLTGCARYMLIIWLGAFFPILLNTMAGVQTVNPTLIDVAKVFGADKKTIVVKTVFSNALPEVFAGMRIGLGVGWMCIVAAEMIGGEMAGLGWLILKYGELLNVSGMIVGMVLIGIIGLLMNETFLRVEKRVFRWRREVTL
ncbi:MAG: ABC transporter permease [Candidatus Hecatellales archaeon]|nr:MAG: ABC transporter permease [Candidatus Hecatellales archaeon]